MLEVSNLSVLFGRHEALHEVGIKIATGETVVILGANGAGKTTLLKSIGGLVKPSNGFAMTLDGVAIVVGPGVHDCTSPAHVGISNATSRSSSVASFKYGVVEAADRCPSTSPITFIC